LQAPADARELRLCRGPIEPSEGKMAPEKKIRTSPVSIVAAACVCMGWLLVVANGAVADRLRVGVNLTTIETLPIYLVEREPAGEGIEVSGGAIPSLTAGKVDVVTNAETQAILRSPWRIARAKMVGSRLGMENPIVQ
jgi:hypothetical protein